MCKRHKSPYSYRVQGLRELRKGTEESTVCEFSITEYLRATKSFQGEKASKSKVASVTRELPSAERDLREWLAVAVGGTTAESGA